MILLATDQRCIGILYCFLTAERGAGMLLPCQTPALRRLPAAAARWQLPSARTTAGSRCRKALLGCQSRTACSSHASAPRCRLGLRSCGTSYEFRCRIMSFRNSIDSRNHLTFSNLLKCNGIITFPLHSDSHETEQVLVNQHDCAVRTPRCYARYVRHGPGCTRAWCYRRPPRADVRRLSAGPRDDIAQRGWRKPRAGIQGTIFQTHGTRVALILAY